MGIKKETIRHYNATYLNGAFIKGEFLGGHIRIYNQDSELLEEIDTPENPDLGGERNVFTYSHSYDGGMICEHRIFALPNDMVNEETLYKRILEVKDSAGSVIEYSEYDIDELSMFVRSIYDESGNNIEDRCEYYDNGALDSVQIKRSFFNPSGREINRVVKQVECFRYKRYIKNGGNIDGKVVEQWQFEYDQDGFITKQIYERPKEEVVIQSFFYDEQKRLIAERYEESDGTITEQVYEYGPGGELVKESTFVDDILSNQVYYEVKRKDDSSEEINYVRSDDGRVCYIEEIERIFY